MLEQENELGKHQQESPGVTETRVNRAPGGDFKRPSKMQPVSVLLQASLQVSKLFLSAEEWQTAEMIWRAVGKIHLPATTEQCLRRFCNAADRGLIHKKR